MKHMYEYCWASIKKNKEHARRLFMCLSTSIRPLRVEELADILAVQVRRVSALFV